MEYIVSLKLKLSVELPDFNHQQILDLARRHQLNWGDAEVKKNTTLVGGHPFLIRLTLYHVANGNVTVNYHTPI